MFNLEIVGAAWLVAAAGAFVPPLLFLAVEWTVKPVSDWFRHSSNDRDAILPSSPLSHH